MNDDDSQHTVSAPLGDAPSIPTSPVHDTSAIAIVIDDIAVASQSTPSTYNKYLRRPRRSLRIAIKNRRRSPRLLAMVTDADAE